VAGSETCNWNPSTAPQRAPSDEPPGEPSDEDEGWAATRLRQLQELLKKKQEEQSPRWAVGNRSLVPDELRSQDELYRN
jgi:hypothetical protein